MGKNEISILVVDDEVEIREMISDYLQDSEGYKIFEAGSGLEALEILKKDRVDLVLSDINMPVMKGFDLLRNVKERYPSIKRVLITAYNVEDYLDLALTYDIGNIFVKTTPFNFEELSTILSNLLQNDIFGLHHYFRTSAQYSTFKISNIRTIDKDAERTIRIIGDPERSHQLELVLIELLTNAVFYGIKNEDSDNKEKWDLNFDIPEDCAVVVSIAKDYEKYAVSITDTGGRLKKSDVLFWLNRQISHDESGLPLGLYDTHGRGLFIARKYIDRLIINIDQEQRTEIIIINYFSDAYKGSKPLYINEI